MPIPFARRASPIEIPLDDSKRSEPVLVGRNMSLSMRSSRSLVNADILENRGSLATEQWDENSNVGVRKLLMSLQQRFHGLDMEELEELYFAFLENSVGPEDQPQQAKVKSNLVEPILHSLHYHFDRKSIKEAISQALSLQSPPSPSHESTAAGSWTSQRRSIPTDASTHSNTLGGAFGSTFSQRYLEEGSPAASEAAECLSQEAPSREASHHAKSSNEAAGSVGHRQLDPPPSSGGFGKMFTKSGGSLKERFRSGMVSASGTGTLLNLRRVNSSLNGGAHAGRVKRVKSLELELSLEQFVHVVFILRTGNHPKDADVFVQRNFPFDPDSYSKQGWDLMIMMLLLYTTFSIPFLLAFEKEFSVPLDAFNTFELIVDCTFCLDIVINFCTAYTDRGIYVTDMKQIAVHYFKSWFVVDFLGSIPFDKIAYAIIMSSSGAEDLGAMGAMRILKIIRVLKMLRAIRLLDKLKQLEQKDGFTFLRTFIRIFRSVFLLVFTAHFAGCIFVMLIIGNDEWNWLRAYDETLFDEGDFTQYTVALYWAIISVSTMGYGDILPVTHEERVFAVFVAIVGTVVFSICMGNLTSLMSVSTGVLYRFEDKLRIVNEWLEWRKMPVQLKRRVRDFYGACWRQGGELFHEREVLAELPAETRKLVMQELAAQATEQLSMVQGLSDDCKADVLLSLKSVRYNQHDYVYQKLDEGSDLLILMSGTLVSRDRVDLFHESGPGGTRSRQHSVRSSLGSIHEKMEDESVEVGTMFGELGLFPDLCKYRLESMVAETVCLCYKMPIEVFKVLAAKYPEFEKKMRTLCTLKAHFLNVSNEALEKLRSAREAELGFGFLDSEARKLRTKIAERQQERLKLLAGVVDKMDIYTVWWRRDLLQGMELGADNAKRMWIKMNIAVSADRKLFGRVVHAEEIKNQMPFHLGDLHAGCKCGKRAVVDADEFTLGTAMVDFDMRMANFGPARQGHVELRRRHLVVGVRDKDTAEALQLAILDGEAYESPDGHTDAPESEGGSGHGGRRPASPAAAEDGKQDGRQDGKEEGREDGKEGKASDPVSRSPPVAPAASEVCVEPGIDGAEAASEQASHCPGTASASSASTAGAFGAPAANLRALELARAMEHVPSNGSSARDNPPEPTPSEGAVAGAGQSPSVSRVSGGPANIEEIEEVEDATERSRLSDLTFQA